MFTVGDYISIHRKKVGLTQEQLAEKLGIGGKSVSKWERNITFPSSNLLKKLCAILEISCDDLLRYVNIEENLEGVENERKKSYKA